MNIDLLKVVGYINYNKINNLLPSFLAKLHRNLKVLVVEDYIDIADGLRRYLNLENSLESDTLVNQIIGMLLIIFLNKTGLDKNLLISELNKVKDSLEVDSTIKKSIESAEYFINNFYEILSIQNKEFESHRAKLILMERVSKLIEDGKIRDKVVDLMLLIAA